ncbi:serine dehydratase [Roseateles aquatilis]|uniref:L-serine ammonia-lyase n=1 Tax=Roseateles aquatilis TaxID=431061 RepID=A0A246JK23_9BURK|nr:pyridoxal-phosphate dependent enzyme [Roseateles aquatilis]OWQ92998.1 serine dehydratase [Roseateles aquatilis]
MPLHIETPLIVSRPLSLRTGKQVWLKLDALQPPGSFKLRGIGLACETQAARGKRRFVSSSGGNAGIAVAYAGRELGIPVTVVVPETTTAHARHLIAQEGATLVVHGASWQEANAQAQSLLDADTAFIHPFDDPLLWTGHATLIDEAVRSGARFDAVVVAVGGGGLMSGVIEGLRRNGLGRLPVVTVETHGADSLAQAVRAGERVTLDAIRSVATSLGAKQVCEQAFALARSHDVRCHVVTDGAALDACAKFLEDHRLLVEPACGAALAAAYEADAPALAGIEAPLIVVCGGATATLDQLAAWRAALPPAACPATP